MIPHRDPEPSGIGYRTSKWASSWDRFVTSMVATKPSAHSLVVA